MRGRALTSMDVVRCRTAEHRPQSRACDTRLYACAAWPARCRASCGSCRAPRPLAVRSCRSRAAASWLIDCVIAALRRLLHQRHAVVAHLDHHAIVVGNLPEDFAADRFLGLAQADLAGVVADAVDDDLHLVVELVRLLERRHQPHDVSQARQIELRDQQHLVGLRQHVHVERVEALRRVDDHVRERSLEQAQHAGQLVGRDVPGVFQLHRPRQQVQARVVLRERALEQRQVEPADVLGDVGERVFGNRVEKHVGVAQAQVEVQQHDGIGSDRPPASSPGSRPGSSCRRRPWRRSRRSPCSRGRSRPCCRCVAATRAAARRPGLPALSGWVRNSFAPARIVRRIKLPSVELLVTRIAQSGADLASDAISSSALSGLLSSATKPMSGLVCPTTSPKNS